VYGIVYMIFSIMKFLQAQSRIKVYGYDIALNQNIPVYKIAT
jgi:hypothetical protein